MSKIVFTSLSFILLFTKANSQNLFPQKVDGCHLSEFCLDCGNPKATYDEHAFDKLMRAMNKKYFFKGMRGQIMIQVLVDSVGKGCVISHTDKSEDDITKDLINYLDNCKWSSAIDNSKPVNSSINIAFNIANDKLTAQIQRVDLDNMMENMSNPGTPEIYNKNFSYKNSTLSSYEITVWQKENSNLPNDMSQVCVADKKDNIWYGSYNGFAKFGEQQIVRLDEKNSPFTTKQEIQRMAVDKNDNKWVFTEGILYKFDNQSWSKFEIPDTKINNVNAISCNDFGETLICSYSGLIVIKNDKIQFLTNKEIKELPSNDIMYAFRDKEKRLWMGTLEGSIMINKNNEVTTFNNSETPLKETAITDAVEDEEGNIFFALYAHKPNGQRDSPQEGFAVYSKDDKWTHYNDKNSGLPADHVNSLFYDRFEKVLWIGTNEAGLVRYDLNNGWENYHNKNSKVPSSYIFQITQDSKGDLYVATFNGMMRIAKKK